MILGNDQVVRCGIYNNMLSRQLTALFAKQLKICNSMLNVFLLILLMCCKVSDTLHSTQILFEIDVNSCNKSMFINFILVT